MLITWLEMHTTTSGDIWLLGYWGWGHPVSCWGAGARGFSVSCWGAGARGFSVSCWGAGAGDSLFHLATHLAFPMQCPDHCCHFGRLSLTLVRPCVRALLSRAGPVVKSWACCQELGLLSRAGPVVKSWACCQELGLLPRAGPVVKSWACCQELGLYWTSSFHNFVCVCNHI